MQWARKKVPTLIISQLEKLCCHVLQLLIFSHINTYSSLSIYLPSKPAFANKIQNCSYIQTSSQTTPPMTFSVYQGKNFHELLYKVSKYIRKNHYFVCVQNYFHLWILVQVFFVGPMIKFPLYFVANENSISEQSPPPPYIDQ